MLAARSQALRIPGLSCRIFSGPSDNRGRKYCGHGLTDGCGLKADLPLVFALSTRQLHLLESAYSLLGREALVLRQD